ncbi:uncharacterized protein [Mycetomoellerius zeteki]|uniref:uncharacterized protein isoform X2 n=1 Tax=Mycetomoellerius zeteki TaxID=64791 RepID=UPI00084EC880|nr:PREDICTED: uncharacterized protein LOC108720854 isoform X2 [Trachymyrmex zeteki]
MPSTCCVKSCQNNNKKGFHLFSTHFTTDDFMDRPGTSSIRLKNLAVPSIFLKAPVTAPVIASTLAPATAPISENALALAIHSQTVTFESSEKEDNENNLTVSSLLSENTASTSTIDDIIKMTLVKKRKLMNNFQYHFKNQEMSPRKKQMNRIIQTLKQKLTRKEKKIQSLQCLLADLRWGAFRMKIFHSDKGVHR